MMWSLVSLVRFWSTPWKSRLFGSPVRESVDSTQTDTVYNSLWFIILTVMSAARSLFDGYVG